MNCHEHYKTEQKQDHDMEGSIQYGWISESAAEAYISKVSIGDEMIRINEIDDRVCIPPDAGSEYNDFEMLGYLAAREDVGVRWSWGWGGDDGKPYLE